MDRFAFVARTSPDDAPGMPAGTRIRYMMPDPAIAAAITGYNLYGCVDRAPRVDPFLPMMMMLNILIDSGPVSFVVGRLGFAPVPEVALYGAMTRPMVGTTHGGIMIGTGISPIGWARLSRRSAEDFRNRIVPLGALFGHDWGETLRDRLRETSSDDEVKHVLDSAFAPLLAEPHHDEARIAAFGAMIAADGDVDIASVAERLDIPTAALRRLAVRYFGIPPKLLLRRARFLRSFLRQSGLDGGAGDGAIDPSYFDQSHYLRDARDFLDTTPRRFLSQPAEFLRGSLAARARANGVAAQALHHVDPPALSSTMRRR